MIWVLYCAALGAVQVVVCRLNYRVVNRKISRSHHNFISTSCRAVLTESPSALHGLNSLDRWPHQFTYSLYIIILYINFQYSKRPNSDHDRCRTTSTILRLFIGLNAMAATNGASTWKPSQGTNLYCLVNSSHTTAGRYPTLNCKLLLFGNGFPDICGGV